MSGRVNDGVENEVDAGKEGDDTFVAKPEAVDAESSKAGEPMAVEEVDEPVVRTTYC